MIKIERTALKLISKCPLIAPVLFLFFLYSFSKSKFKFKVNFHHLSINFRFIYILCMKFIAILFKLKNF